MTTDHRGAEGAESVLDVIARVSGRERASLSPGDELVGDLGFDSLKAFELIVEIEEALGLEIAEDDIQRIHTVGDVLTAVQAARAADAR